MIVRKEDPKYRSPELTRERGRKRVKEWINWGCYLVVPWTTIRVISYVERVRFERTTVDETCVTQWEKKVRAKPKEDWRGSTGRRVKRPPGYTKEEKCGGVGRKTSEVWSRIGRKVRVVVPHEYENSCSEDDNWEVYTSGRPPSLWLREISGRIKVVTKERIYHIYIQIWFPSSSNGRKTKNENKKYLSFV